MNILRFLICSGRLGGPQRISPRQMTVADDLLACYSYVCQDKAEFDKLSKEYVAKANKRFWADVDVFNTETKKRSKVTEVIGVILAVKEVNGLLIPEKNVQTPSFLAPSAEEAGVMPLSQTPGDSQSGGEQSPAESKGTLSEPEQAPVIDIAADLAANASQADDVEAGQEQPKAVSEELPPKPAPPTSTPPAKRKAGRPAKAK